MCAINMQPLKSLTQAYEVNLQARKKLTQLFYKSFITYDWDAIWVCANIIQPLKRLTQADEFNLQAKKNAFIFYTKVHNI